MRPWCFAFTAAILVTDALAAQIAFSSPSTTSKTLVSELSADPDYTSLLGLLQRARLIPTLNRLNGSTFFAHTNDAIEQHSFWTDILRNDSVVITDNIQEKLRQQLFYHLLNFSITAFPDESHTTQVLKTLHYPRTPVQPPSHEPPPNPPWMPIPGGTLGGEPQRLRVSARNQAAYVGVDSHGQGGIEITKGVVDAGNGMLLGISGVLEPPPDLGASFLPCI